MEMAIIMAMDGIITDIITAVGLLITPATAGDLIMDHDMAGLQNPQLEEL